jgi:hypothetical protein
MRANRRSGPALIAMPAHGRHGQRVSPQRDRPAGPAPAGVETDASGTRIRPAFATGKPRVLLALSAIMMYVSVGTVYLSWFGLGSGEGFT